MANQLIGVAIVITYDAIVSLLILKLIDSRLGLRVSSDAEMEGTRLNASWRSRSVKRNTAESRPLPCSTGNASSRDVGRVEVVLGTSSDRCL